MLIFEAEGKAIKHKPIGHPRTSHFINRNETSSRALDSLNLHKRSSLRDHRGNPEHLSKDEFRRALDVDIDVKQSRSKENHRHEGSHHDESESEKKIIGLFDGLSFMQGDNQTCEECVQEQQEIFKELSEKILRNEEKAKSGIMKPAYKCDDWEVKSRTCWLNRNIGDTVTFILSFSSKLKRIPKVIWKQEFHERGKEKRKHFVLQRENPTWNIVIGSKGHEMRVSPISEIDVDPNLFSAGVAGEDDEESTSALFFRIRLIPNDLGFVYPGETLVLNMASYISLPLENMHYAWYMEKDSEFDALPSNMKSSPSGSVLTISELRKEQEGVMTCAVYSNLEILVAKKRFLIKEISSNDILMNPTNRSHPFEGKRNSQHSIIRRRKPEEKIEKSLRQLESENSGLASKEGFDVDYNMDKEEFSLIDVLLESSSVDAHKPSDSFNRAGSKPHQKSLKLPPPASAVKMDAIQQERTSRQNSPDFFNVAQQQQYQQQEPDYQQQQGPQYQQQQQLHHQQQQGPQYQQQQQLQHQQQQSQYQQGQHLQQYEQQLQQQYEQQRLKQEQYEQQRLQQEQYGQQQLQQEQQQQLQQEQQQRLQQEQQQRLQQEEQQRLQQEQYEQQRLQQEQYEQQRLQQEQQQQLQQEQQQRFQQEQQRLQQEQQQRLQHEQQQRSKQEQQQRLQQEQQRLHQEQKQQPQPHRQQEPTYPGEGREPWMEQEVSSEQSERSAEQNLSPSLAKYSMGQIHIPKENDNFKGGGFLSRQRHSTELISSVEQMARPSEQHSPNNYKANSGQIQNLSGDIPDNLRGLNMPPSGEDYPSQNFPVGVKGYSERKNMAFIQKEFPPPNFPLDNRQYSEKKTTPYNQKEYSAQNFPANHREHLKQNNVPPGENEFWSPEIFIENKETRLEDEISKIISRCENDRECAGNAACIKGQSTGFCRCLPNFSGNGISCWEDMIPRHPRKFSNVKIQDRTNMGLIRSF